MNTLENFKEDALELWNENLHLAQPDLLNLVVEHTHTQTIQSVRERVEQIIRDHDVTNMSAGALQKCLLADLKDLEAPVEGQKRCCEGGNFGDDHECWKQLPEGDKTDYTLTRGQIDGMISQLRVECADTISAQTYNKALNDLSEKLERGIM